MKVEIHVATNVGIVLIWMIEEAGLYPTLSVKLEGGKMGKK